MQEILLIPISLLEDDNEVIYIFLKIWNGFGQADAFISINLHPLFFHDRFTPRLRPEEREIDSEASLVAKNENEATGTEPDVKKEWM